MTFREAVKMKSEKIIDLKQQLISASFHKCTFPSVISVSRSPEHCEGAARNLSKGGKPKRYLPEFTLSKNEGVDMTPNL